MNGEPVFADTSGFLALLDGDDAFHVAAAQEWATYGEECCVLWTSDYVRLESWSLIQRRLGGRAALDFYDMVLPVCTVLTVGNEGFERAADKWRLARRRKLSLVDVTSFDCMRGNNIRRAFTFDRHFAQEGFSIPSGVAG